MVQGQCLGLTKLKLILCLFIIQFQGQNVSSPNAAVEDDPQLGTTAADDGLTYTVVIFLFASSVTTEAEDIHISRSGLCTNKFCQPRLKVDAAIFYAKMNKGFNFKSPVSNLHSSLPM